MELLDVFHLACLTVALVFCMLHMNSMRFPPTPLLDFAGWWLLSVGLFGDLCWQLWWLYKGIPYYLSSEHVFMGVGITAIVILHCRPRLRAKIADRRVPGQKTKIPPHLERRAASSME